MRARSTPWGAHAPSRVVFGALAEDRPSKPFHAACDHIYDKGIDFLSHLAPLPHR